MSIRLDIYTESCWVLCHHIVNSKRPGFLGSGIRPERSNEWRRQVPFRCNSSSRLLCALPGPPWSTSELSWVRTRRRSISWENSKWPNGTCGSMRFYAVLSPDLFEQHRTKNGTQSGNIDKHVIVSLAFTDLLRSFPGIAPIDVASSFACPVLAGRWSRVKSLAHVLCSCSKELHSQLKWRFFWNCRPQPFETVHPAFLFGPHWRRRTFGLGLNLVWPLMWHVAIFYPGSDSQTLMQCLVWRFKTGTIYKDPQGCFTVGGTTTWLMSHLHVEVASSLALSI